MEFKYPKKDQWIYENQKLYLEADAGVWTNLMNDTKILMIKVTNSFKESKLVKPLNPWTKGIEGLYKTEKKW